MSDQRSPKRLVSWGRTRSIGRNRFIWTYGVLRWGGFMFCFSMAVFQYRQFGSILSSQGNVGFRVGLGALVWTYVGYLYGRSLWNRNERDYRGSDSMSSAPDQRCPP